MVGVEAELWGGSEYRAEGEEEMGEPELVGSAMDGVRSAKGHRGCNGSRRAYWTGARDERPCCKE